MRDIWQIILSIKQEQVAMVKGQRLLKIWNVILDIWKLDRILDEKVKETF